MKTDTGCRDRRNEVTERGHRSRAISAPVWRVFVLMLLACGVAQAQAPEGIPRDLARQRAEQISDVRYHLAVGLADNHETIGGLEEIRFHLSNLSKATSLLLDFREGEVAKVLV